MNPINLHFPKAASSRSEAGGLLAERGNRLTMIVASVLFLSVAMLYITVQSLCVCLMTLPMGISVVLTPWQTALIAGTVVVVFWLMTLFLTLPLFYGLLYMGGRVARREEVALRDVLHSFSSGERYRRALRMGFATLWRASVVLLVAAVTYWGAILLSEGDVWVILLGALVILGELVLALMMSTGGFFTAYFVYARGMTVREARRASRRMKKYCHGQACRYVIDYLPWLLLSFATAGVLLVADILPRMTVSYFGYAEETLNALTAHQNQTIPTGGDKDHE